MSNLKQEHISRIRIRGFKSIKKCDIKLNNINVLIGSNGSGKSNFISFFVMLHNILAENLAVYVGQSGLNSLLFKGIKYTDEIFSQVFFGSHFYGFTLVPTEDNRLIFEKEYLGDLEGSIQQKSLIKGHSESHWRNVNVNEKFSNIKTILEKQNWRAYHFHDTGKSAKVKQDHNISNNKNLIFDASNLAAFLFRIKKHYTNSYKEIIETIKIIAPYFNDFHLEPLEGNDEKIILRWNQVGCEDIFNASQLSDGTLRFICLATLLLQPEELQTATIIVDEPELGLHPFAITIFAELVKQISQKKQVIISTQSVELLNEFNAEDVIVVDRDKESSTFKRLDEESLKDWLENDYTLGELWNKNILGGRLSK